MTSITPEDIRALAPLFEAITAPDPTKQVQYDGLSGLSFGAMNSPSTSARAGGGTFVPSSATEPA